MDEPMRKSGQYPNVAIIVGSDPKKVLQEYDLSTACKVKQEIDKQVDTCEHSKIERSQLNVSQNSSDTRERLEQDIIAFVTWFDIAEDEREVPIKVEADYSTVMNWLDRQAAITERECMERATSERVGWDCAECAEGLGKELDARCDPLKERIAELEAERDRLADERYRYKLQCERWEAKIVKLEAELKIDTTVLEELRRQRDELTAECDRLQKVVQIQADSFQKLERELKEALDG